jgi:hypothetical protein
VKKIDISKACIKIRAKLFHLTRKKRENLKQVIRKMKKKVNLKVLRVNPYISKGVPHKPCCALCVIMKQLIM